MKELNEHHSFMGMQRDLVCSKQPVNFLYDARNIRLTSRGDSTMLAVTNEKGTEVEYMGVSGKYLGHACIGKYLVLFTVDGYTSRIYRYDFERGRMITLYYGWLGFSENYPITTLAFYENENIQKVYWVDGLNQPRLINIVGDIQDYTDTQFDFVRELELTEKVRISRNATGGYFPSGVIQYAFTYINKYAQESNIFYISPLFYIMPSGRGAAPDESVPNSFNIRITGLDSTFHTVRIYSIQRTSLNGTAIVKRVRDVDYTDDYTLNFIDTGMMGDVIDPTEVLYKGNNSIVVNSITQKDNTLFLGGLKLDRGTYIDEYMKEDIRRSVSISSAVEAVSNNANISSHTDISVSSRNGHIGVCSAGFKHGETYRLGVQFQYKTGAWSEPVFIEDAVEEKRPYIINGYVNMPTFKGVLTRVMSSTMIDYGFRKVRPVVVFPSIQERDVLFQCVTCSTVFKYPDEQVNAWPYGQEQRWSSWFFRHIGQNDSVMGRSYFPKNYIKPYYSWMNPNELVEVEVECALGAGSFGVDSVFQTLHSPDIEWDDSLQGITLDKVSCLLVGKAHIDSNRASILTQTASGTIDSNSSGPENDQWKDVNGRGYGVSYYEDYIVDDGSDEIKPYSYSDKPVKWFVFPWAKSGSLNNDTSRETGTQSALLKKKIISNLRYYNTKYWELSNEQVIRANNASNFYVDRINLSYYGSDQPVVTKNNSIIYQGNIDTVLAQTDGTGKYFIDSGSFKCVGSTQESGGGHGIYTYSSNSWSRTDRNIGDKYAGLVRDRNSVRMRYKSTPHFVGKLKAWGYAEGDKGFLAVVDVLSNSNSETKFGGSTEEALKENMWIPCGEPQQLTDSDKVTFKYSYGDTYYQQYDCLKTYPFTKEDENQMVEIGCVYLESRINQVGRYDKNRDLSDNTIVSKENFNLMNMVYSQKDNFITYRILDEDYYDNSDYPNQITWSKEKQAAADVDLWTNITLTNTYDMDGTKGKINYMTTFKDNIFIFQDKSVSNLLFNSRVQIPTSDGTPIEITNNYKVEGHRTLSDGVGCSDKNLVKQTSNNIYFIDSISNHLFSIGDGLQDISTSHYMTSWFVNNKVDRILYDNINHDLYITNDKDALCYSELLGQFVSFFDYGGIDFIETYNSKVYTLRKDVIFRMFEGDYNNFFGFGVETQVGFMPSGDGGHKPWYITFISNGTDVQSVDLDKIFTNIDYRMDLSELSEEEFKHSPNLTFDYMQVTTEYQDTGVVPVKRLKDATKPNSFHHKEANTQKKFRIWRIQIPRALTWKTDRITGERKQVQSNDRIRNPWCKITLGNYGKDNTKALLHDINVQYYI